jgi:hypothetical protein
MLARLRHPGTALLMLLVAVGCFLNAPLDIYQGNYGAAAVSVFIGIALISLLPKPKPKRRRI